MRSMQGLNADDDELRLAGDLAGGGKRDGLPSSGYLLYRCWPRARTLSLTEPYDDKTATH
jgi:hypothetical protein